MPYFGTPQGRERVLNWGTEEAEADARLPGDELLEDADVVATRAITVDAPPSAVWPWIAQMGLCVPRIPSMALTSRVAPPSIRS